MKIHSYLTNFWFRLTFVALVGPATCAWSAVDLDGVERLADEVVNSGEVPGIIIAVKERGAGVTTVVRGVSDRRTGEPMRAVNAQRIGSITKTFTVTRLLQLVDEGKLSLDDPIRRYVKGLRNGDATLRELADMTSGIFNYTEDVPFILGLLADPTQRRTDREIVAVANAHRPYFRPGAAWYYSNTNTILLGMVVERVTGARLGPEIVRQIIQPLGLKRTSYPTGIFLPAPFSHGYLTIDDEVGLQDVTLLSPSALSGAGAIVSTADDLLVWGKALAEGRLLSRGTQLDRLAMVNSAQGTGPYYDRYGLGMGRIDGWLGHSADVLGYQSLVMHNLIADMTVTILVNGTASGNVPTEVFQKLTPLLPSAIQRSRPRLKLRAVRTLADGRLLVRGRASSRSGVLLVRGRASGTEWLASGRESWRLTVNAATSGTLAVRAFDRAGRASRVQRIALSGD